MATIKLEKLSLEELKQLQKDVAKAIDGYETRKRQEALATLDAKAKEMGFTLAELTGASKKSGRSVNAPKFRHPENPEMTWSGRGRQPGWIKEALKAGKSLDDYLIAK
ncbi:H-NS histone family protein [Sulfitobacter sp. D35]|uniref:H-NS histone family protein n=1 Tax=Sulfitobacter sp. D35 TaxID=3083252 RepID=UPI00296EEA09|nr:H-NS histone family protein [Sulfitobacter sp. D35]MDW4500133.1 H-NS histone family protein [Sulfitobacter sp. D35]